MHPNTAFRKTPREQNIEFARARSFGTLAVNSPGSPLISHIPFQLSPDGHYLEAHLVRSNPIVKLLKQSRDAVMAVSGGDAYISPDWYGIEDQVPTWNYIAVHIRGELRLLDQDELPRILDRLSANMEERLRPKAPWKTDKLQPDTYLKMQKQIIPIAMKVDDIQGTWKLSQNKPSTAIHGALRGAEQSGLGSQIENLVALMRKVRNN